MKHFIAVTIAAAITCVPAAGLAWRALNRHEVYPISKDVFEVVYYIASGPREFWCAAGDYAISQLRAKGNERIYIWRGIGPSESQPGKKAVQFSFTPPTGVDLEPGISLSVKTVGDNMRAAMAQQYCYGDDPFYSFRRWN